MRLLLLVVLAAGLATHTCAQLFPFSNLHSYFKSMTRDGPGAETDADSESGVEAAQAAPAAVAAAAEPAPALAAPSRLAPAPAQELRPPANHRLEEDATPAEAAPVVGLRRLPYPSQVLQPPAHVPALDYGALLAAAAAVAAPPSHAPATPSPVAFVKPFVPTPVPQEPAGSVAPAPIFITPAQPSLVLQPPSVFSEPTETPTKPPPFNHKIIQVPNKPLHKHKPGAPSPFPKKYHPENEKASPQKVVHAVAETALVPKKKNAVPKKASAAAFSKEQLQFKQQQRQNQHVAATVEAASFQRPAAPSRGPLEQDTAESGFAGVSAGAGLGSSDRVEFQMHGQQGPHTYKWGYDTGKGHNRQFRYEERDAHGHVKGHYGFYDKHGKLQVVNYSADPEHGYQADGNFGKHGIH